MKTFSNVLEQRYARRWILKSSIAASIVGCGTTKGDRQGPSILDKKSVSDDGDFQFKGLPPVLDHTHHVAEGHEVDVLIRWGDPIFPGMLEFGAFSLTAEEQERRFGHGNDYVALLPTDNGRHLMIVNHESTVAGLMFEGEQGFSAKNPENIKIEQTAHGLSVFEVHWTGTKWTVDLNSTYNRRITTHTPIEMTGPAAGHQRLRTTADPSGKRVLGTLGNCAGGVTPWGTVLTCEENINHYFRGEILDPVEKVTQTRMRVPNPNGYSWFKVDERFNTTKHPTEPNRFGWVVEFDPYDPSSTPKKRTALGRFFHESANPVISSDGSIVVYMGDDTAFEYLYRFVSTEKFDPKNLKANADILDSGELSVAIFESNGTLEWHPLNHGDGPLVAENGFHSQADVLIDTRRAAGLIGGTPMDRPEDVEVSHHGDRVFVCLTKNRVRGDEGHHNPDSVNPRANNHWGHIIELTPPENHKGSAHHASEMRWDLLLLAGTPGNGCDYGKFHDGETFLGCPDNACLDPEGRLWITTDGSEGSVGVADGIYAVDTGTKRGCVTRLFAAPMGAEVTGPCFNPDGDTLFACIQHPALVGQFDGGNPATRWPDFDEKLPPRPAVIAIRRVSGERLG